MAKCKPKGYKKGGLVIKPGDAAASAETNHDNMTPQQPPMKVGSHMVHDPGVAAAMHKLMRKGK